MSEERGFEIIDKRRVSAEAPAEEEGAAHGAADAGGAAAAQEGAAPEAQAPTDAAGARTTGAGTGSAEPGTAGAGADEAAGAGFEGGLPEVDAQGVVSLCINMLHEVAWVKLGLVASPMTQKVERDLDQARLAIDCAADLVRHLESHVDAPTRRDLQNLISTLRLNWVQQSQR